MQKRLRLSLSSSVFSTIKFERFRAARFSMRAVQYNSADLIIREFPWKHQRFHRQHEHLAKAFGGDIRPAGGSIRTLFRHTAVPGLAELRVITRFDGPMYM